MIRSRSHRLLAVLVLLWAAVVLLRIMSTDEPARAPLTYRSGRAPISSDLPTAEAIRVAREPGATDDPIRPIKNVFAPFESTGARPFSPPRLARLAAPPVPHEVRVPEAIPSAPSAVTEPAPVPPPVLAAEAFGPTAPAAEVLAEAVARRQAEAEQEAARQEAEARQRAQELAEQQRRQEEQRAAQQARQKKELALQQARQLMEQYRFLGYLENGGHHQGFLAKGTELYVVKAGEMLEGRLKIKAIDASSIKLQDAGTELEATILLVKESKS